jgi:predicted kinase
MGGDTMVTSKTNSEYLINFLALNYSNIYKAMETTEHGYLGQEPNPYHLEGTVLTHTKMVMEVAVNKYPGNLNILVAALLHDIGKPYVYEDVEKSSRRRFINHEAISTFMAKPILQDLANVIAIDQELILKVISLHGSLYNYFEDGRIPAKNRQKVADKFGNNVTLLEAVAAFYYCDHTGRTQAEPGNTSGIMEDFDAIASLLVAPVGQITPSITVLVGPPRAGKSTWADKHASNATIISRDVLVDSYGVGSTYSERWKSLTSATQKLIDQELQANFNLAIKTQEDVIIDMTNMSKKSRRKWLANAKGYYKKAIVFVEAREVLLSRNTPAKNIPEYVIHNMLKSFVMPMYDEVDYIELI